MSLQSDFLQAIPKSSFSLLQSETSDSQVKPEPLFSTDEKVASMLNVTMNTINSPRGENFSLQGREMKLQKNEQKELTSPDSGASNEDLTQLDFYHGRKRQDYAEKLLADKPQGYGVFRYSERHHGTVLSYTDANGQIGHHVLAVESLREVMETLGIKHLIMPQKSIDLNHARISDMNPVPLSAKYDYRLILNLGSGHTAERLAGKTNPNIPVQILHLDQPVDLTVFSRISASSRIDVIGHCAAGLNYLHSDEILVSFQEFVELMIKNAPQLQRSSVNNKITINIIACDAGADGEQSKSFAFQFSQALDSAGIPALVVARVGRVKRAKDDFNEKTSSKDSLKFVFETVSGITSKRLLLSKIK